MSRGTRSGSTTRTQGVRSIIALGAARVAAWNAIRGLEDAMSYASGSSARADLSEAHSYALRAVRTLQRRIERVESGR